MIPEETQQRIIAAMTARIGGPTRPCSLCGNPNLMIQSGYATVSVGDSPSQVTIGGSVLPCAILMCPRCGNTLFVNLLALGLHDLVNPPPPPPIPSEPSAVPGEANK